MLPLWFSVARFFVLAPVLTLEGGLVGAGSWGGKSWERTRSRGSRFFGAGCRSPDRCRRRAQAPVAAAHGERRWALGLLEQKASKRTAGRQ